MRYTSKDRLLILFNLLRPSWTRRGNPLTINYLDSLGEWKEMSVWDRAFEEVEQARKENRRPNPEVFVGLTKAPGEKR